MHCKLFKIIKWYFFFCFVILQSSLLVNTVHGTSCDIVITTPQNGGIINEKYITVTGYVTQYVTPPHHWEDDTVCISWELWPSDGGEITSFDCVVTGYVEYVNVYLQAGQLKLLPMKPGEYTLKLRTNSTACGKEKEVVVYYEPCENECIKEQKNIGPPDDCQK